MKLKLNLAPEVYQASQRAKRRRRIATTVGVTVCAVAVGLVVLGGVVAAGQAGWIAKLNGDIKSKQAKVHTYPDLETAATAQQHLQALGMLYGQRSYFSKFFDVLQTLAPQGIAVSNVTVSSDNLVELTATAKSYDLVTKFAKALEASNREIGPNASPQQQGYFQDIQLSGVSDDGTSGVTFKLTTQMSSEVTSGQ